MAIEVLLIIALANENSHITSLIGKKKSINTSIQKNIYDQIHRFQNVKANQSPRQLNLSNTPIPFSLEASNTPNHAAEELRI